MKYFIVSTLKDYFFYTPDDGDHEYGWSTSLEKAHCFDSAERAYDARSGFAIHQFTKIENMTDEEYEVRVVMKS